MEVGEENLYRHQRVALAYLRANSAFALFMEQGTGKTLPTLLRILELLQSGAGKEALIVCPKAAIGSWNRDMDSLDTTGVDMHGQSIQLVSYDMVWRRSEYHRHWSVLVLDEAHKIKRHTSQRSKCLLRMALDSDYRFILTGTPISNGQLENIWSLFAFLRPIAASRGTVHSAIFGGSYYDFLRRYTLCNQYHKPYKYREINEIQQIVSENSYRVEKAACLDLPEKLPDEILDIELQEKKLYRELHKHSTVESMDIVADNPLVKLLRLRQVCSGFIGDRKTDHELKSEKLAALEDFLDGWQKKLVIFCEFRRSIDLVCGLLDRLRTPYVSLDGAQSDKSVWRRFQADPAIQVIVCQYQSANAGIDLFAADTVLYYEPCLSSNVLEQSRDRIHRIGQWRACSYVHMLTKGTVEVAIYKALKGYSDFNQQLFTEYMSEYQKGIQL